MKCENFRIPVIFQDREHAFWKMLIKAISHKVRIPVHFRTEIFGGDREHAFLENAHKGNFAQRGRMVRISH